jgi:cell division protein FtsB
VNVRVRWDRVGRLAMTAVIVALLGLYVRSGVSLLGAWKASRADRAQVVELEAQNALLKRERSRLSERQVAEEQARRLGMARPGERPYVISGLPSN